jgi:hypothetical protein
MKNVIFASIIGLMISICANTAFGQIIFILPAIEKQHMIDTVTEAGNARMKAQIHKGKYTTLHNANIQRIGQLFNQNQALTPPNTEVANSLVLAVLSSINNDNAATAYQPTVDTAETNYGVMLGDYGAALTTPLSQAPTQYSDVVNLALLNIQEWNTVKAWYSGKLAAEQTIDDNLDATAFLLLGFQLGGVIAGGPPMPPMP